MISFIIIGKNEGAGIKRCLSSIVKLTKTLECPSEIIYVDSASTDNSVELAVGFEDVDVYVLTEDNNAAIARNVGADKSKGDVLFFIDGDMELLPAALSSLFDKAYNLNHDFISGNFENFYYSQSGEFSHREVYKKVQCNQDEFQKTTGGLFAITRKLWFSVNGMNPLFAKGQDLDLGYRLAKRRVFLLRKKEVIANHHTIDYKDKTRLWQSFKNGSLFLPRAILYRKHILNYHVLKRSLSSDPTLLFLIGAIFFLLLGCKLFILFYPLIVFIGILYSHGWHGVKGSLMRFVHQILRDVGNLFAFFFYYPSKNSNVKFEKR